tara:strand:+ start:3859 stop:5052 length:1194 start_codon:yes stop_codon:yes gene_type:complete
LGLLDFLYKSSEKRSANNFTLGSVGTSNSGVRVSEINSIGLPAVWAAVRLLSETISSLPLNVYRNDKDGSKYVDEKNNINLLLSTSPNSKYTSFTWRNALMNSLLLWGNGYSLIKRNGGGRPIELELLDPAKVDPLLGDDNELYYKVKDRGNFNSMEILHIVGLSFNGLIGKSPIQACKEAVGFGLATQKYGSNFFQGANLSGVLEVSGVLTDDAANRLRQSWNSRYSGLSNSHSTAVLENGTTFKPISMPLADAEFVNASNFSVAQVARIFRVPPHMIGDLSKATYSNIEQQSLEFAKYSLTPYLINIEQELNRKLLSTKEQNTHFCKFRTTELLRSDANSRADYYRKLFEVGALSPNDIRSAENMNKIPNGDDYFVPLNLGELGKTNNENNNQDG